MNPKQERFLGRVTQELDQSKFVPCSCSEIADTLKAPVQAVEAVVKLGLQDGRIVEAGQNTFYSRAQIAEIVRMLRESAPDEGFDPQSFRSCTGLSRGLADRLYHLLSREELVERRGPKWVLAK